MAPDSKWMRVTMPPTSEVTSAPLTAISVPMGVSSFGQVMALTVVADTVTGGVGMLLTYSFIILVPNHFMPNTAPNTTPVRMSMMSMRLVVMSAL